MSEFSSFQLSATVCWYSTDSFYYEKFRSSPSYQNILLQILQNFIPAICSAKSIMYSFKSHFIDITLRLLKHCGTFVDKNNKILKTLTFHEH